jgi:hypothetical protein
MAPGKDRSGSKSARSRGAASTASEFHAVEIQCSGNACDAARAATGVRYLSSEAPILPLERCDRRRDCQCRYRHFTDRRGALRRTADGGLPTNAAVEHTERRQRHGRRLEDDDTLQLPAAAEDEFPSLDDTYYDYVRKKD